MQKSIRKIAVLLSCIPFASGFLAMHAALPAHSIKFEYKSIPFRLENDETSGKNAPESMAGGVAVFDYNGDGRPDIFFTNGANIATLTKDDPKYTDRLFRNDGNGVFTDVTKEAGLAGNRLRCRCGRRRLRQRWPCGLCSSPASIATRSITTMATAPSRM
jgi:hypothetical protein